MKKRLVSFFLAVVMIIGIMPTVIIRTDAAQKIVTKDQIDALIDTISDGKIIGNSCAEMIELGMKNSKDKYGSWHAWCAQFVKWACKKAGVADITSGGFAPDPFAWLATRGYGTIIICTGEDTAKYANIYYKKFIGEIKFSDGSSYNVPKDKIRIDRSYTPSPGDLVLFDWVDDVEGDFDHIGIMRTKTISVEGNTGNHVVGTHDFSKDSYQRKSVCAYFHFYTCDHSGSGYSKMGWCSKCNEYMPNKKTESVADYYKVNKNGCLVYKAPYIASADLVYGPPANAVSKNATAEASQKITNGLGEVWYKVSVAGKSGYMKETDLTYDKAIPASVSCSNGKPKSPGTWKEGNPYSISGKLTAKGCTITKISGQITDANGKAVQKVKPYSVGNVKSYEITDEPVDTGLKFGNLAPGTYTYQITAEISIGDPKTFESDPFTIVGEGKATCAAPKITSTPYVGGNKVTIKSATSGATIKYSYGGNSYSGTTPVSFNLTETATIKASASKSGMNSSKEVESDVSVSVLEPPSIQTTDTAQGVRIVISGEQKATLYYSIGDGEKLSYSGPLLLKNDCILTAYAEKAGCISSMASKGIGTTIPAAPEVSLLSTKSDIPVGTAINVKWNSVTNAESYTVEVSRNGTSISTKTVTGSGVTVPADAEGTYTVTVRANNYAGVGYPSRTLKVVAHKPSCVTFVDDGGNLITSQWVEYGKNAIAPQTPSKKGYTFTGWSDNLNNITSDCTIKATYKINTYTVKFYDTDGQKLLDKQEVTYNNAINSTEMECLVSLRSGYSFIGWHISEADPGSAYDLEHIDSDMSLVATETWSDPTMPMYVEIANAVRNEDCTGYKVSVKLSVADYSVLKDNAQKAKIIVALKSSQNRTMAVSTETINLTQGLQNVTEDIFVSYKGSELADLVEVTVVGIDGNDRTGGALYQAVSVKPTISTVYSTWLTEEELRKAGKDTSDDGIQTKTQYRYYDSKRETTTRTNTTGIAPEVAGYEYKNSTYVWGSWSAWSDSAVSKTSNREVKTQQVQKTAAYTEYRYGRWKSGSGNSYCNTTCKKFYGGTPVKDLTTWSKTRYKIADTRYSCGNITGYGSHSHTGVVDKTSIGEPLWNMYTASGKDTDKALRYWWEESRSVSATYKTQYQYRDKQFTYYYEKWNDGPWSGWSDSEVQKASNDNIRREIDTRVLYRYIVNDTTTLKPQSTTTYNVAGELENAADLNGVKATVLVYKETNSDPTEPQLEHVGQITLGENNSYSLSFQTKEEPSESTGDFIVALAPVGASNVVNVDKIRVPREQYNVTFHNYDGTLIADASQTVMAGDGALVPAGPELDGYDFVCWDKDVSCITDNTEVHPIYWPKTYSVVVVDYENEDVRLKTDYQYGDALQIGADGEEDPTAEGMIFEGWRIISNATGEEIAVVSSGEEAGQGISVTEDLIVVAAWTPITYSLSFVDYNGDPVGEVQNVCHGDAATPPTEIDVPDGMVFLGWSTDRNWWSVTEDGIVVTPIVAYELTTGAPVSNLGSYVIGGAQHLELGAEEGAVIYYTLDGSTPDPESLNRDEVIENKEENPEDSELSEGSAKDFEGITYVYDPEEPLLLEETAFIQAIAVSENKNASNIITIDFVYDVDHEDNERFDGLREIGTYNVYMQPGETVKLQFEIEQNPGLAAYMFVVDADPGVFGVVCDEENQPAIEQSELFEKNGEIIMGNYQEGIGWEILWYGINAVEGDGTVFTLELKAEDSIEEGTYPVTVRYSPENTLTDNDINAATKVEGFGVAFMGGKNILLGDVNNDGFITVADVVRIARYLLDDISFNRNEVAVADVTGDGKITNADVIRLSRYIVGLVELG